MVSHFKIRTLFIGLLAALIVLIGTYSGFIIYTVKNTINQSLIEQTKNEVAALINVQATIHIPKELFSEQDLQKTQSVFDAFFREIDTADIIRIKVWDMQGRIIAANDPSIVGKIFSNSDEYAEALGGKVTAEIKLPEKEENRTEKGYGQLMEVYVPIRYADGQIAGIIETYTILDSVNAEIAKAQYRLMLSIWSISLPFLIALTVIFTLLYRNMYKRVRELISFAKMLGSGELTKKINIDANDEIAEIARAMNSMSEDLTKTLVSKSELERLVEQRTSELKLKMDEIERMNKHMIGRELKMVELKNELDALKAKSE